GNRSGGKGVGELLEALVIEECRDFDDSAHTELVAEAVANLPRSSRARSLAPRSIAFRAARRVASRVADWGPSPARRRLIVAAPKTSPQPVGSSESNHGAGVRSGRQGRR